MPEETPIPLKHTADASVPHEDMGDDRHCGPPDISKDLYKAESVVQDKLTRMIQEAGNIKGDDREIK